MEHELDQPPNQKHVLTPFERSLVVGEAGRNCLLIFFPYTILVGALLPQFFIMPLVGLYLLAATGYVLVRAQVLTHPAVVAAAGVFIGAVLFWS